MTLCKFPHRTDGNSLITKYSPSISADEADSGTAAPAGIMEQRDAIILRNENS